MIDKSYIIGFIVCFTFLTVLVVYAFSPIIESLSVCEERGWDGSEYNTEVRSLDIGENFGKDIILKCNKAEKETDTLIDVLDALPGLQIRNDVKGGLDE